VTSLFEQAGGEFAVRLMIHDFVGRAFDDTMIGYLFRRADIARVREMEYQFAAAHLGGEVAYQGRPLTEAHRPHRILDGQFARRLQLLRDVLAEHRCPSQVIEHWVRHTEALRSKVVFEDMSCGAG
jgi:hemoglobin